MKEKIQKHRLILLLGILVALIFFYFGVNTWMESQGQRATPPPIVRTKPPVQIKSASQPVKPEKPKVSQPKTQVAKAPEKTGKRKPAGEEKEQRKEKKVKVVQHEEKPKPAVKKKEIKEEPKKVKKKAVAKKEKAKRVLRDYVIQIGAFKIKKNADKMVSFAKKGGYEAFIIEEEKLYKVRLRVKAENMRTALKNVKRKFKDAFVVR